MQRDTWVRDQERAEWGAILSSLTAVDVKMPHVFPNLDWFKLTIGMLEELRAVLPSMRNSVFITPELEQENLIAEYRVFVSGAAEKIKEIDELNDFIRSPDYTIDIKISELNKGKMSSMDKRVKVYGELYDEFHKEANRIRSIAQKALAGTSGKTKQRLKNSPIGNAEL